MAAGDSNPTVNVPDLETEFFQRWKRKPTFKTMDVIFTALSFVTYVLDFATDLALAAQYLKTGHLDWSIMTFLLSFIPLLIIQCISLRWLAVDDLLSRQAWIPHWFLLGLGYRYYLVIETGREAQREDTPLAFQRFYHHQNDVCMLRLFESFLESAPQLLLQLHIMAQMESWHPWTIVCALASTASLGWGIAAYGKAMRNTRPDKEGLSWTGLILQAFWRGGAVGARIVALLLASLVLHEWMSLALACHWLVMTWWIVAQKTDFCSTWWEEKVYNAIVGVVYCFCFFNLKEGPSRAQAATFDLITAMENVACVFLFVNFYEQGSVWFMRIAPMVVALGSIIGLISQLVYYLWFHPSGPKDWACWDPVRKRTIESPTSCKSNCSGLGTLRSLKFANGPRPLILIEAAMPSSNNGTPIREEDLNLGVNPSLNLEEDIIPDRSQSESSQPCVTTVSVELNTRNISQELQETPKTSRRLEISNVKSHADYEEIQQVASTACEAPQALTKSNVESATIHGAQAVCSQDARPNDVESVSEKMSTHDYENMPVANVNRTDWGVRHWSTYPDIQENNHDYSTCHERDQLNSTFTSTATSENYSTIKQIQEDSAIPPQAPHDLPSAVKQLHVDIDTSVHNQLYEFIWNTDPQQDQTNSLQITLDYAQKPHLSTILEETELSSNASLATSRGLGGKNTSQTSSGSNVSKAPNSNSSLSGSSPASIKSFREQESAPSLLRNSSSSLVNTVEEVMNDSLCNLFYPSMSELFILFPPPPNSPASPSDSSKYSKVSSKDSLQTEKSVSLPSTPDNTPAEAQDLTYVEVSFLSKLGNLAPNNTPIDTPGVRRHFSILRDKFDSPNATTGTGDVRKSPKASHTNKENIIPEFKKRQKENPILSPFSPVNLRAPNVTPNSSICTSPPPLLPRTPLRRTTTLSPNSKIFQKS